MNFIWNVFYAEFHARQIAGLGSVWRVDEEIIQTNTPAHPQFYHHLFSRNLEPEALMDKSTMRHGLEKQAS